MAEHMLTTEDNPFDPFTQFKEWYSWDTAHGYNTLGYLARIVRTSSALSEADQSVAIENAIDEILEFNLSGVHKRVRAPDDVIQVL